MPSGRIDDIWGDRTPFGVGSAWPERVDAHIVVPVDDVESWRRSACVLCSNGCGLELAVKDGRMVGVRGRADDRVNHGRLGPKGLYGWQANNSPDRLKRPLIRRGGELVETDWETAMSAIVERSKALLGESRSGSFGFYTSGQLFMEEYYAQTLVARVGIGTNHLDGNTRLCTATADMALKESFGTDGSPGSYEDVDLCDTLFLVGHNVAETQTVLWMRMLDRLHGPDRPKLVCVDPRPTKVAREADVHLAIRSGTNLALLNAIQRELIENGWVDENWVTDHTVGYEALVKTVSRYTAEHAAEICGVPAGQIQQAAELIGTAQRLMSTVLQGVYQSHQATAAAVAVNNINLLRGMIGRPGCTVLQMNGQPTAQNTREAGANGDLPCMHNWQNDKHVQRLADLWNVEQLQIPHWAPPTHVMQMMRYIEEGSIRFFWVTGTNPAVSLPELGRIRSLLAQQRLFLVVQDAFMTETAELADVVLPAAMWGEKTGTFTNADRTIHLSEQAVDPPGEARADLDILLDYARRMGFEDKDGAPLVKFSTAEEAFEDFKRLTAGRPNDQSALTYAKLRECNGIQWPVTDDAPWGTSRLYTDHVFNTDPDYCEDYGHDLLTGAANTDVAHKALEPNGRAILKTADYTPPPESPGDEYPLLLTTGRTVYHFHTRTKSARSPELQQAAPDPWVEIAPADAEALGIAEGDLVRVETPRGQVDVRARLNGIRDGVVFVPFHYGYWDALGDEDHSRAANELTITAWDPVSKQPTFKTAAARIIKLADGDRTAPAPTNTASEPVAARR
ncbi:MAG: molybdopterin oxidoreductase family protein [Gaiellales bacterium]